MFHINDTLQNNYYVPNIYTQINEMLCSLGPSGAHGFLGETGYVLKS